VKLIKKSDLTFLGGRLVDLDDNVVASARLVHEVNEIAEIQELLAFVKENATKIKAADKPLVFKPTRSEPAHFSSSKVAATPLLDADKADAVAKAEEFLDMRTVEDIGQHLLRYPAVARFLDENYIEVTGDVSSATFLIDPLKLSVDDVVSAIEEYHDPATSKLIGLVRIDFS
jgi:hypothetical protein